MDWSSYAKRLLEVQKGIDNQALESGYAVTPEAVEELKNAIRYIEAYNYNDGPGGKVRDAYEVLKKYSKGYGGTRHRELPNLGLITNTSPGKFETRIKGKRWRRVDDEQDTHDYNPPSFVEARKAKEFLEQREAGGLPVDPMRLKEARERYERLGGDKEYEKELHKSYKNWRDNRFFELSPEQQRQYYEEDQNNQGAFNQYMSGISPLV